MRAILVSVDYADFLALTLPYNRHHFEEVWVVTSASDRASQDVALGCGAKLHITGAFYKDGADFNKWLALEEGLDKMGREGWLCVMDADVLWPKNVPWLEANDDCRRQGNLYTPRRRMLYELPGEGLPTEETWAKYPLHSCLEFSGYSQIFHASDPVLGPPPWYEINWRHAGGGDSFLQARWPLSKKIRPPFEVLHLGSSGENWCGRATPYLDGSTPQTAEALKKRVRAFRAARRGKHGPDRFSHEKI